MTSQFVFHLNSLYLFKQLQAEISDATGAQWITIFRNEAERLLGVSADEFGSYKLNVNLFNNINKNTFIFSF